MPNQAYLLPLLPFRVIYQIFPFQKLNDMLNMPIRHHRHLFFNNKKVMLQYQIRKQRNSHEIYIFSRIQCHHPSGFIRNEEHTFQFNIIIMCDMKQILSNVRIYSCFISVGINVGYSNRVCWCQS